MILGAGFNFFIGLIFFVMWVVFAVMGVIFFHNQNRTHTRKLNKEEREYIDQKYQWLKYKDIFLYYQIYNQTFELLKNTDCHKRLFESIFDKYFKEENPELYEEFKNQVFNIPTEDNNRSNFMIEAYKRFLINYAVLEGRANRAEYWWVVLWNVIITLFCLFLGLMMISNRDFTSMGFGFALMWIYNLATIIPNISLTVRRLHDSDKTGWLCLIALIPYIGILVILVLTSLKGTKGPNRYGKPSDF